MSVDVVVIGAGHNGLVAAALLARRGHRVVVLERRDRVGGLLDTVEIAPGVRAPGPFHTVGRLRPSVAAELGLESHGLRTVSPAARVFSPLPDGSSITLWADPQRTAADLASRSAADAAAWPRFDGRVRAFARFVGAIARATPPDIKKPDARDALAGLGLGRAFRRLGPREGREATRALPMAIADFVAETFTDPALRAAVAVRGVRYTSMGPWSAGTTAVMLSEAAEGADDGAAGEATVAIGGPGALAAALAAAASAAGVEIRTGAEVTGTLVRDGRVVGVRLADGETLEARAVVSSADPKRTITTLLDPVEIGPHLRWRGANIRTPGTVSTVDLALTGVPAFHGADAERLGGRILFAPTIDDVERAHDAPKFGRIAERPYLDMTMPSLHDPSLAGADRHVLSVVVHGTPYRLREGDWASQRERLADTVIETLETVAPGIGSLVAARRVMSPVDLEREYGVSGGHLLHAEPGLDQWFAWRPMLGHARHRFGMPGMYLCGSGAHPGGGVTGGPGENAAREIARDLARRA